MTTRKDVKGKLLVKKITENGIDKMVQISTIDDDGNFSVITVGFSKVSGLFSVNVQPSKELSLCAETKIVGDDRKVLFEQPKRD